MDFSADQKYTSVNNYVIATHKGKLSVKYFIYSGNHLINAKLPDNSEIYYPQPAKPGVSRADIPEHLKRAVENPQGMPPLKELVNGNSKFRGEICPTKG